MRSLKLSSPVSITVTAAFLLVLSSTGREVDGFVLHHQQHPLRSLLAVSTEISSATAGSSTVDSIQSHRDIASLRYRELKRHLQSFGETNLAGTTAELRKRLREYVFPGDVCISDLNGVEMCGPEDVMNVRRSFSHASHFPHKVISADRINFKAWR